MPLSRVKRNSDGSGNEHVLHIREFDRACTSWPHTHTHTQRESSGGESKFVCLREREENNEVFFSDLPCLNVNEF